MVFGIFIYDGVEPIDLAALGVLSMAKRVQPDIEIHTVAPKQGPVCLSNGLRVLADFDLNNAPKFDVLIVTGGPGWVAQSSASETLAFLRDRTGNTLMASLCTGAMILASAGILDGKSATTKREVVPPETSPLDTMRSTYPAIDVREASLVDNGTVVTGGGVSLCIDTILYLLGRLYSPETANRVAHILEYQRAWAANFDQFPPIIKKLTPT
jgi:transcriptional regulator GlxA family with amidase domain